MGDSSPRTILIVDDDPRNRTLLVGQLTLADDHRCIEAQSGAEALEVLGRGPVDLALVDVMMPVMDGYELCRRIRRDPRLRLVPVVLITALTAVEERVQGLDAGADDFLSKPVHLAELRARVRTHLRVGALQNQLDAERRELARTNEELRRLEESREAFVRMIVHDLTNPLTALLGSLEVLVASREQASAVPPADLLGWALQGAMHLQSLVEALAAVPRLERGEMPLARIDVELGELCREAAALYGSLFLRAGVRIEVDAPQRVVVRADREALRRVLDNLLMNALRHSPRRGTVHLSVGRAAGHALLEVADEGTGIPEEIAERVFEPAFRLEGQTRGYNLNQGLGLTFCKLVVEASGGRIAVGRSVTGGALFRIELPVAAAEGTLQPAATLPRVALHGLPDR